jgi:hypothetical protein
VPDTGSRAMKVRGDLRPFKYIKDKNLLSLNLANINFQLALKNTKE